MRKARLLTIGTEITSGEVVNTNASWVSLRLEDLGVRVFSHLSVRDQKDEILKALRSCDSKDLIIVTGGLGPTSDDVTRECVAEFSGCALEFDERVWQDLADLYQQRGLPLRQAHKRQCHFPRGSDRLANRVGTALGFSLRLGEQDVFVLPGPPRELEGMWTQEVEPRLRRWLPPVTAIWSRWTCLGAAESEIAELVEKVIDGSDVEVGYRAQVPYVKVKIFTAPGSALIGAIEQVLKPYLVGRGFDDLAAELLARWPDPELHVYEPATHGRLFERLLRAHKVERPVLALHLAPVDQPCVSIFPEDGGFRVEMRCSTASFQESHQFPYKLQLSSERGRRSAAEWALWFCVRALRSQASTSS